MQRHIPEVVPCRTPAAQYLRMSDDGQQYSIPNQKAAIQEYADRNLFSVIKTYADAGKSGVVLKHRTALHDLLRDVMSGDASYKAILVYDVSRWGRFPNTDEAAHYEFLCTKSGIPLHYCAESFANDETPSSSLLKSTEKKYGGRVQPRIRREGLPGQVSIGPTGILGRGDAGLRLPPNDGIG